MLMNPQEKPSCLRMGSSKSENWKGTWNSEEKMLHFRSL